MGEEESKRTRVRWLDAARYVVATAVTMLTIAVIAWAIVQSVRPEVLYLRVVNGYVTVGKIMSLSPPVAVNLSLAISAVNPSGRATIRYYNVTVHLLFNKSAEMTYLNVRNGKMVVAPQIERDVYVSSTTLKAPSSVSMEFVEKIFHHHEIRNTTLRLQGIMQTQTSALNYTTGRLTMYDCYPVTMGTSKTKEAGDVPCSLG